MERGVGGRGSWSQRSGVKSVQVNRVKGEGGRGGWREWEGGACAGDITLDV